MTSNGLLLLIESRTNKQGKKAGELSIGIQ